MQDQKGKLKPPVARVSALSPEISDAAPTAPDAREVLESLATGEAEALPTVAARAALRRQKGDVEPQVLWTQLASPDKGIATLAMLALAAKPKESIALFKECLKPVRIDSKHVAHLLSRLDSDNYVVRNQTMQELESCGPLIGKHLEEAHKDAATLESRRRIEELRAKLPKVLRVPGNRGGVGTSLNGIDVFAYSTHDGRVFVTINENRIDWENAQGPQWMRADRAIAILEHFGDAEARRLLERVASGEAQAPPTIAARAALWRLTRNSSPDPPRTQTPKLIEPTPEQLQAVTQAFAKLGGQFTKDTDWITRQPLYFASLPRSATDDDLKKLPFVPFSFGLSLATQEKITDAGLANLASVKNLRYLSLNGTNVTDAGLKNLVNLQELCTLDLSCCMRITDIGILADVKNLSALNLHFTYIAGPRLREISRLKGLRFLDLSFTDVDDADLSEIVKLQSLSSLSLSKTTVTDDGIHELAELRNLTRLWLGDKQVTDESLVNIAKIKTLTDLGLSSTAITDRGLRHLAKLKLLTHLSLAYTKVTDHGLKQIAVIRKLKSLDLRSAPVTFAGLKELSRLQGLSSLSLSGDNIGDVEAKEIAKCTNLSELSIGEAKVTDEGIRALAKLDKLSSLDLNGRDITFEGVVGKNGFSSLSTLSLFSTGLTDAGLGELFKMKKLSSLNLVDTKITDAGLKGIEDLVNLRSLDVTGSKVTDEGLKEIARVAQLKELGIRENKVTDVGLREIIRLKNLSSLGLDNSMITNSGMRELGKLTNLNYLGLWAKVNDEVFRELQKALPRCYISRTE